VNVLCCISLMQSSRSQLHQSRKLGFLKGSYRQNSTSSTKTHLQKVSPSFGCGLVPETIQINRHCAVELYPHHKHPSQKWSISMKDKWPNGRIALVTTLGGTPGAISPFLCVHRGPSVRPHIRNFVHADPFRFGRVITNPAPGTRQSNCNIGFSSL